MSDLLQTLVQYGVLGIGSIALAVIGWKIGGKLKMNKEAKKINDANSN